MPRSGSSSAASGWWADRRCTAAFPIERMFRDVQAGPLHPPTNDLALEGMGRAALGIPPDALPRWGD